MTNLSVKQLGISSILLVILMLLFAACGSQSDPAKQAISTPAEEPTALIEETEKEPEAETVTVEPAATAQTEEKGVLDESNTEDESNPKSVSGPSGTFSHNTVGFQIDVPAGWDVEESNDGVKLSQETLELLFTTVPPTGLPAGDLITFTSFPIQTGIDVRRDNFVYEERTKAAI